MDPQKVIERLGAIIPLSSTTLTNYVVLQALVILPLELLIPFFASVATVFKRDMTPRQIAASHSAGTLKYGVIYPIPILIFVIGLLYAPIAPLILPFVCLFFALAYYIYKYLLIEVYDRTYGSGTVVVDGCLFGLGLMQVTMMGVLALKSGSRPNTLDPSGATGEWSNYAKMVVAILPLITCTFFVSRLLDQAYQKRIEVVPLKILGELMRSPVIPTADLEEIRTDEVEMEIPNEELYDEIVMEDSDSDSATDLRIRKRDGIVSSMLNPIRITSFVEEPTDEYQHLSNDQEPTMTQVAGVLDPTEAKASSYLHPALIGRLPVLWTNRHDFEHVRRAEDDVQNRLIRRLRYLQRLGGEEEEDRIVGGVHGVVDGMMSWIRLALS